MASQDTIAQLRQDITTAADAGDEAAVSRLRTELAAAMEDESKAPSADEDASATREDQAANMDYEGDTPN